MHELLASKQIKVPLPLMENSKQESVPTETFQNLSLTGTIVLCSWTRHFAHAMSLVLITHVKEYTWKPENNWNVLEYGDTRDQLVM